MTFYFNYQIMLLIEFNEKKLILIMYDGKIIIG